MKLFVVLYASSYAVRRAAFLHAEQPLKQTLVRGFLPLLTIMTLIGALLLHEPVGLNAVGGLALVLTGIFVTGKKTEQSRTPAVATETTLREQQTGK